MQYSYDDNSVAVVNSTYETLKGMKVSAKLYNIDATEKGSRDATLDLAPDSSVKAFDLPKADGLSQDLFPAAAVERCRRKTGQRQFLLAVDQGGHARLAKQQDTVYTPQAEFGDLTGLNSPAAGESYTASSRFARMGVAHVTVSNPGKRDRVHGALRVTRGKGGED